jgi:(p)ppGpp synthase/HD superfamily hydrolase
MTNNDLDPLRFAKFFAATKHGDQKYGVLPYTHHLAQVEAVLRRFGMTQPCMLTAAWLHDVVEDTGTKLKEVEELFGGDVAELVAAVTNEPGPNRKIRAALTYPKIRACSGGTALKLADRIANVEAGGKLVDMYKKEYEDFRRGLYNTHTYKEMWAHLDGLMGYKEP